MRASANRQLLDEIRRVHGDSRGRYGSPRVHAALRAEGRQIGRNRVARLMHHHGICARQKRRFCRTTDSRHGFPLAPNLLGRRFTASAPDRMWLADITYVPTAEGWLYLAVVLDMFSRRVVGWAMDKRITRELTLNALRMAIATRRPRPGLLHHSDRGSQGCRGDDGAAGSAARLLHLGVLEDTRSARSHPSSLTIRQMVLTSVRLFTGEIVVTDARSQSRSLLRNL